MFVHLHVHSQYSLLEGAIKLSELVKRTKEFGMPAVALTDSANLFGAVDFYELAKKEGIKPIIGAEIYYLPQGSIYHSDANKKKDHQLCNLVLLAQNAEGYKNLCRLLSIAHMDGFYYRARVDKELLQKYQEGLFALSGTLRGEVHRHLVEEDTNQAEQSLLELKNIFNKNLYLEISNHQYPHEAKIKNDLITLSQKNLVPLVATNECRYLEPSHQLAHQVLHCIKVGRTLKEEEDRALFVTDQHYFKNSDVLKKQFADLPEALGNTVKIAEQCEFGFNNKTYFFPKYEPPPGMSIEDLLVAQASEGLLQRWERVKKTYPESEQDKWFKLYQERLDIELKVILSMGFASYFIIVADFINYAKNNRIPVGPGRGSAAGSLVAYCTKITDINPIPFDLLFERFLNPERISMPDVDIDFCMNGRDAVIRYVTDKYKSVSQIITFGTLRAKAVVRDVGRVLDLPYSEVDRIAKLIPNSLNITLEEAITTEPKIKELIDSSSQVAQLIEIAKTLEGLNRHASTHAAGVVIGDRPLTEFLPLYRGSNDETVCQFDMKSVEKIGLVKFDFLGLKTLTVLDIALKIVKRVDDKELNFEDIPLDDPKVYECLSEGDALSVFQLESSGMRDLLTRLKPSCFEDMIALVALYRPGPLGSGMVDDFINRKHGKTAVSYELPQLEPILKDTYGVILYQEQVMKIASVLANYSLGEADLLRRAMGKKKPEEMAKQRERFLRGAKENKIDLKKAEKIFDLMAKFAEYGFNKSHSAAYALVSYHTAYLKTHYFVEYMASVLSHEMGNTDKILMYLQDCKEHGMNILPPDINESYRFFSVNQDRQIRFGLAAIKGVGDAAIASIIEVRKQIGSFEDFFHFCEWVDTRKVNKKVLESLIKCGAFDRLASDRASLFATLEKAMEWASNRQNDRACGQSSMFDLMPAGHSRPQVIVAKPWTEKEKLANEKEALGFYISGHPLDRYQKQIRGFVKQDTSMLHELDNKAAVALCGIVSTKKEITTKKGKKMAFITLEDLKGSVEVVVFSDCYQNAFNLLHSDDPIFVKGRVDREEDNIKIIAEEILQLDFVALKNTHSIHFRVQRHIASSKTLDQLKKIILDYPGHIPTYLHIVDPGDKETVLSLPADYSVGIDDLFIQRVETLFGTNSIIFQ